MLGLKHMKSFVIKLLTALLLLLSILPSPALSQEGLTLPGLSSPESSPSELLPTKEEIQAKLTELQNKSGQSFSEKEFSDQQILYLEQQLSVSEELPPLKQENETLLNQIAKIKDNRLASAPKNFAEYEDLKDERILLQEEKRRTKSKIQSIRGQLLSTKTKYEDGEKNLRLLKQDSQTASPVEVLLKTLENEVFQSLLTLRRLELEKTKLEETVNASKQTLIELKLSLAKNLLDLSDKELKNQLKTIEEREQFLKKAQDSERVELEKIEKKILEEQDKEETIQDKDKVEQLRQLRALYQTKIRMLGERSQRLNEAKNIWELRFQIFRGKAKKSDLKAWKDETSLRITSLNLEKKLNESALEENRKNLSQTEDLLLAPDTENTSELKLQKTYLDDLDQSYDENIKSIESHIRLNQKLAYECNEQLSLKSWKDLVSNLELFVATIWNYEIFTSNDYPVTLGKIISGLLLLVLGYLASEFISRKISSKLLTRFDLTQGANAAIRTLTFYLFFLCFALLALKVISIPLTVFTFLGGALAIGVGFGSQNIVNNFISGLVLLTEQPIRVGDLIEVDGFAGSVRKIGARSTVVRTGNNIDIIVPNSAFLEKNVINWTRNNTNVRLQVSIGIAYGSDTKIFSELLVKAASEHEKVHVAPKAFVLLANFGDNALNFELHFWASIRSTTERAQIESDLRFRIDGLCREAGISIAFPQRDIHLDTTRPIEVRMVGEKQ